MFQNRPSVQSVNREENLEFLEGKFCKDMPSLFHWTKHSLELSRHISTFKRCILNLEMGNFGLVNHRIRCLTVEDFYLPEKNWPRWLMRPRDKERCCSGSILMKDSDIIIYIMKILWRGLEIYRKAVELEVKFRIKLHLDRRWENTLVLRITRKKIHWNFREAKYDIKQYSDGS